MVSSGGWTPGYGALFDFVGCQKPLNLSVIEIPCLLDVIGASFPEGSVVGDELVVHHGEHAITQQVELCGGAGFILSGDHDLLYDIVFFVGEVGLDLEP